jgi:phosphoesterase RecJ-like protein
MATEAQIADLIRRHNSFLVCSHMNPDGDALGSSLALGLFLEREDKEVVIYNQDLVPALYDFLPGTRRIQRILPKGKCFEVSFLLDCASPSRVGEAFERFEGKGEMAVIDHHPPTEDSPGISLVRTEAAATGELLYDIMAAYGRPPTAEMATALYVALMTDTGSFRFSNTTSKALRVGGDLLEAGVDLGLLIDRIYESYPQERFRLLARVLETLEFPLEGKVATLKVTQAMLQETGCGPEVAEGFVDLPRSVRGVQVAILFKEAGPKEYRVSLRSRGGVDVGRVAMRFQGGGHPNAAGCTIREGWDRVYRSMLEALGEAAK